MIDDNACSAERTILWFLQPVFDFRPRNMHSIALYKDLLAIMLAPTTAMPMHESRPFRPHSRILSHAHHAQFKHIPLTEQTYASAFAASLAQTAFAEHNAMQLPGMKQCKYFHGHRVRLQHARINRHMHAAVAVR